MDKAPIKGEELLGKLVMHKNHQKRKKVFVSTEESRRASKKCGETPGNREETPKKIGEPAVACNANLILVMAAIVSGGTFGSHACFYSDATVITSSICGIDNKDLNVFFTDNMVLPYTSRGIYYEENLYSYNSKFVH